MFRRGVKGKRAVGSGTDGRTIPVISPRTEAESCDQKAFRARSRRHDETSFDRDAVSGVNRDDSIGDLTQIRLVNLPVGAYQSNFYIFEAFARSPRYARDAIGVRPHMGRFDLTGDGPTRNRRFDLDAEFLATDRLAIGVNDADSERLGRDQRKLDFLLRGAGIETFHSSDTSLRVPGDQFLKRVQGRGAGVGLCHQRRRCLER